MSGDQPLTADLAEEKAVALLRHGRDGIYDRPPSAAALAEAQVWATLSLSRRISDQTFEFTAPAYGVAVKRS